MLSPVRTAIIPAAATSSRLKPLPSAVPLGLLPVWNKPVVQHVIDEAVGAGIEQIIVVADAGQDSLWHYLAAEKATRERHHAHWPNIDLILQEQWAGIGEAISRFVPHESAVAVLLPNELMPDGNCLSRLVQSYAAQPGTVLAVRKVPLTEVVNHDIVDVTTTDGDNLDVRAVIEGPAPHAAPSQLAMIGRYILDMAVIRRLVSLPHQPQATSLASAIAGACSNGRVQAVHIDSRHFDCSDFSGLLAAGLAASEVETEQKFKTHIQQSAA